MVVTMSVDQTTSTSALQAAFGNPSSLPLYLSTELKRFKPHFTSKLMEIISASEHQQLDRHRDVIMEVV